MVEERTINATATIGTDSYKLFEAETPIKELIISNTGASDITLSIGNPAVAGAGIVLKPTFTYSSPEGTEIKNGVWLISSAAGGTVGYYARI